MILNHFHLASAWCLLGHSATAHRALLGISGVIEHKPTDATKRIISLVLRPIISACHAQSADLQRVMGNNFIQLILHVEGEAGCRFSFMSRMSRYPGSSQLGWKLNNFGVCARCVVWFESV